MYYKTLWISYLTFLKIFRSRKRHLLWDRNNYHVRCEGNMFAKTFSCAKCGVSPLILVFWRLRQEDLNSSVHVTGLGHLGIRDGTLSEKLWIRDEFVFSALLKAVSTQSFPLEIKPNALVTALLWQRPGIASKERLLSMAWEAVVSWFHCSPAYGRQKCSTRKPLSIGCQEAKRQHTLRSPASSLSLPPGSLSSCRLLL